MAVAAGLSKAVVVGEQRTERLIRVTVGPELAEMVSDRMWSWGVRGVTEADTADGRVTLSTSVGDDKDAIARALGSLDPSWSWRVDDVDATAAEDWRRFAEPVECVGGVVIAPAWQPAPETDDLVIAIEPGSAFGLGDHPTTRSSVTALVAELDRRADAGHPANSVLDVGCGTGVLAIVAARKGVGEVRAIDLADAAVGATLDNAERNGLGGRIRANTDELGELERPADGYDLVIANILAPTLVSMASDLRRLLADDGTLIISGILSEGNGHGHRHVLDALFPMRTVATIDDDGWATVTLRPPGVDA